LPQEGPEEKDWEEERKEGKDEGKKSMEEEAKKSEEEEATGYQVLSELEEASMH